MKNLLLRIQDVPSPYAQSTLEKLAKRQTEFEAQGGSRQSIADVELFASHSEIVGILDAFVATATPHIVLDITCLPKRFFFPFMRLLLQKGDIENLVATYSIPETYTSALISEGFQEWRPIPLFCPSAEPDYKLFVISIGFLAMGLPEQVKQHRETMPVKLLFPFPPGPPGIRRNWEFVMELERGHSEPLSVFRIDAYDVSQVFDHLVSMSNHATDPVIFAPYGPKPHSLAICLFASMTQSKVCYTQPSIYHPDYSKGVSLVDGDPETRAYCIRLQGRDFYSV